MRIHFAAGVRRTCIAAAAANSALLREGSRVEEYSFDSVGAVERFEARRTNVGADIGTDSYQPDFDTDVQRAVRRCDARNDAVSYGGREPDQRHGPRGQAASANHAAAVRHD